VLSDEKTWLDVKVLDEYLLKWKWKCLQNKYVTMVINNSQTSTDVEQFVKTLFTCKILSRDHITAIRFDSIIETKLLLRGKVETCFLSLYLTLTRFSSPYLHPFSPLVLPYP